MIVISFGSHEKLSTFILKGQLFYSNSVNIYESFYICTQ